MPAFAAPAHSMKIPKHIQPLIDEGTADEILRRLMSGKEAAVYVVRDEKKRSGSAICCSSEWIGDAQGLDR